MKRALVSALLLFSLAAFAADKPAKAPAPGKPDAAVWVNTETGVYHCMNVPKFKKTKKGEQMSQADARAKGYRPARNKPCTK